MGTLDAREKQLIELLSNGKNADALHTHTAAGIVGGVGVEDHGELKGLLDDDHTQYLTEARHDALPADNPHSVTLTQAIDEDALADALLTVANLNTLVDGSSADGLHTHSGASLNVPCLTSPTSSSTLCLSDDTANQTLTGDLGNLFITPTTALIVTTPTTIQGLLSASVGVSVVSGGVSITAGDLSMLAGDITFVDPVNQEIAGIDAEDLLDKSASETVTGASWTFQGDVTVDPGEIFSHGGVSLTNGVDIADSLHLHTSAAISGGIDCLTTTDASPSTLCLTDNNVNQTLTGNLGNLIINVAGTQVQIQDNLRIDGTLFADSTVSVLGIATFQNIMKITSGNDFEFGGSGQFKIQHNPAVGNDNLEIDATSGGNVHLISATLTLNRNLMLRSVTPAAITTSPQHNYAGASGPPPYGVARLSSTANVQITGFEALANDTGRIGRTLRIINVGSFNISLQHLTGSLAANQIQTPNATAMTIRPNRSLDLWYDETIQKWRPFNVTTLTQAILADATPAAATLTVPNLNTLTSDGDAFGLHYHSRLRTQTPSASFVQLTVSGGNQTLAGNSGSLTLEAGGSDVIINDNLTVTGSGPGTFTVGGLATFNGVGGVDVTAGPLQIYDGAAARLIFGTDNDISMRYNDTNNALEVGTAGETKAVHFLNLRGPALDDIEFGDNTGSFGRNVKFWGPVANQGWMRWSGQAGKTNPLLEIEVEDNRTLYFEVSGTDANPQTINTGFLTVDVAFTTTAVGTGANTMFFQIDDQRSLTSGTANFARVLRGSLKRSGTLTAPNFTERVEAISVQLASTHTENVSSGATPQIQTTYLECTATGGPQNFNGSVGAAYTLRDIWSNAVPLSFAGGGATPTGRYYGFDISHSFNLLNSGGTWSLTHYGLYYHPASIPTGTTEAALRADRSGIWIASDYTKLTNSTGYARFGGGSDAEIGFDGASRTNGDFVIDPNVQGLGGATAPQIKIPAAASWAALGATTNPTLGRLPTGVTNVMRWLRVVDDANTVRYIPAWGP